MPPRKPPFEYIDINRPSFLEDDELGPEITKLVRRNKILQKKIVVILSKCNRIG